MRDASEILLDSAVSSYHHETDVLVVGLGAAGACAALEAQGAGANVVVLERASGGGGTSANSGGLIYMGGGTPVQEACGFEDSVEEMFKFLMYASAPSACEEKIRPFCEESVAHFHWLEAHGVPFKRTFWEEPGMEPPTDDCLVYSGGENCHPFVNVAKPAPRAHKAQARHAAGGHLMQCLLATVEQRGLAVQTDTAAEALIQDANGRVVGVAARCAGEEQLIRARRGVILTAGGFILNDEMVRRHAPILSACNHKNATPGDDGRAIRMGQAAGAALTRMHMGEVALPITIPHRLGRGIYVNAQGQRFINEDTYYGHIGLNALFKQDGEAYLLVDNEIFERNFIGSEPAFVEDTIPALANVAGFPPGALEATVALYNEHATRNEDPVFHKRADFVQPLANPPYALLDARTSGTIYATFTLGGVETLPGGEVVDPDGRTIAGLYAAGRTAALFCGLGYPGSGMSLADATFFGRWAGRSAAAS